MRARFQKTSKIMKPRFQNLGHKLLFVSMCVCAMRYVLQMKEREREREKKTTKIYERFLRVFSTLHHIYLYLRKNYNIYTHIENIAV